jgi:hypothetical protein
MDNTGVSLKYFWPKRRNFEFENRVLRRILRPKREEVAGGWRTLHNEELHNLYASSNIRVIK